MSADADTATSIPSHPVRVSRRQFVLGGLGLAGLCAAATAGYATGIEPRSLIVTSYAFTPPGWPVGHRRTITAIADVHAGGPNMGLAHIQQVVDVANLLKSDLTVLLGDYVATHRFVTERVAPDAWAAEFKRLEAPLGVYAILGNHDWWHGIADIRRALGDVNIPVLENDAVLLGEPRRQFWLAGLGDQLAHRIGRRRFLGVDDLPGTLARAKTDDPIVLLAHEPDIFVKVPDRVALTLAGHTHGGQIRLPGIWERTVPSAYGGRFAYGHIVENDRHMIVSGGLGTSLVPMRLGVPPEIVRIELGA
jgi:predicted MPP superfamily phosphohydrolase